MPDWLIYLAIAVAASFVAGALAAKSKPSKPSALTPPVASAGMAIPRVRGTKTVTGTNTLWFGDVGIVTRIVK